MPSTEVHPLRILLNATSLSGILTGTARYARELYEAIRRMRLAKVDFFVNGKLSHVMPDQSGSVAGHGMPPWIRYIAREAKLSLLEHRLNRTAKAYSPDVYHETGMFPLSCRLSAPTVLTIYDLSLLRHKEFHPTDRVAHFSRHFHSRLRAVDHVITLSEFMRSEIVEVLGLAPDKITAIPLATAEVFYKRPQRVVDNYLADKGIQYPYILSVATSEPRKNLQGLVRAFRDASTDCYLVIAGWAGWLNKDIEEDIRRNNLEGRIICLGHLPDAELALLYSGASALAYSSFYEGFGLPILEAMSCGCPVICSDSGAMAEVTGDAAYGINANDPSALAKALDAILNDAVLRKLLITRGHTRAQRYSWEKTARATIAVFEQVRDGFGDRVSR
ncbi:MAG: glycosyltransferase family 4 protein [Gammaproteobacteria bacterium]|nr:glycosyltransferase family 4 protein [Gammaproteobacteria bacterium]MDH3465447.1 glycosyltransferase family 4 protein [Gammaproteobacteria bacterium]